MRLARIGPTTLGFGGVGQLRSIACIAIGAEFTIILENLRLAGLPGITLGAGHSPCSQPVVSVQFDADLPAERMQELAVPV